MDCFSNKGVVVARCLVETYIHETTRIVHYLLIDTLFDKLVLYTSNKRLADNIEDKINRCEHTDEPYDIQWHEENTIFNKH